MDMTAIAGVLSALRGTSDIAKAMIGLRDANMMDSKVLELQQTIIGAQTLVLDAQATQAALVQENDKLKAEVKMLIAWDDGAKDYDLAEVRQGRFVRQFKASPGDATPGHRLCTTCFDTKRKSVLQEHTLSVGRCSVLICTACGAVIYASGQACAEHASILKALTGVR